MENVIAGVETLKTRCFFIVSCARSGSTSLATILDRADNVKCATEPAPFIGRETREMMEGRLKDPSGLIETIIASRVRSELEKVEIYGEKNLTYAPFIPYLYDSLKAKFVFIKRDGRDVVRSLLDWHDIAFGNIYRECKQPGSLSPRALKVVSNLPIHLDANDYSRPRPLKEDPLYEEWGDLTRAEMCAFYWSKINELYLENLKGIPRSSWMVIDYTRPTALEVKNVADFIGAEGLYMNEINGLLNKKINSLQDRFMTKKSYPKWPKWTRDQRVKFSRIADPMMRRLGYL